MNAHAPAPSILDAAGVDPNRAREILGDALAGADDGELFVERSESESFLFDDGRLKSAAYDATEGVGLRVVAGETAGYAHASEISEAAIRRAGASAALARRGYAGVSAEGPRPTNARLYGDDNPLASPAFSDKVALLQEIDAWARARDPRVVQVMASLAGERRTVEILRADGGLIRDVRPLARINVQITVEREGRRETGYTGSGGRAGFVTWITQENWQAAVDINLTGAFLCTREAFRLMKNQTPRGGRIINNGSISAHVPRPQSVTYTATKHAITGLTKATSLDGRKYDIACGQIDIGNASTDMTEKMERGILQANGSLAIEPTFETRYVADAVSYMASLPLHANVQFMTVMATNMPFIGRG